MRSLSYTFILIACIYIGLTSCTEEVRPLTKAEMNIIDTLYRNETELIKEELDSLCEVEYDLVYQRSVDSIKAVRLKEIKSILGK